MKRVFRITTLVLLALLFAFCWQVLARTPVLSANPMVKKLKQKNKLLNPKKKWLVARASKMKDLTDIRYESFADRTRIVLFVSGIVQIEHGEAPAALLKRLPRRLYIDLTPCLPGVRWRQSMFGVKDGRIKRVRVGRNTLKTTRVVFELKGSSRFRLVILTDPVRIVIDLVSGKFPSLPSHKMPIPASRPFALNQKPVVIAPKKQAHRKEERKHSHSGTKAHSHDPSKKWPYVLRYQGRLRLPFPVKIRRIAVDPGHGGTEDGTVGRTSGLKEKTITLDIARQVVAGIHSRLGVQAFLTRYKDETLSLYKRAELIKRRQADLLISIHINSHRKKHVQGVSTYILNWEHRFRARRLFAKNSLIARENKGVNPRSFQDVNMILRGLKAQNNTMVSKVLGVALQRGMMKEIHKHHRAVRNLGVRLGLFYILFAAEIPGVLVEASYLSNEYEEGLLATSNYRERVAKGIVNGVERFLKLTKRPSPKRKAPSARSVRTLKRR